MTFRGSIKDGAVIFDEPLPLKDGTIVQVEPLASEFMPPPGSRQAMRLLDEVAWVGDKDEVQRLLLEVQTARESDLTSVNGSNPLDCE